MASSSHDHTFEIREENEILGEGAFGQVMRSNCLGCSEQFARKYIRKQQNPNRFWERKCAEFKDRELTFLQNLTHPHVVSYIHHEFSEPDGKELYIWTELCKFKDIGGMNRPASEAFLWRIAEAIGSTLATCHYRLSVAVSPGGVSQYSFDGADGKVSPRFAILHRDIKPRNIFLAAKCGSSVQSPYSGSSHLLQWHDDYIVKVGDFGMAVQLGEDGTNTFGGTPWFTAPEILHAEAERKSARSQMKKVLEATNEENPSAEDHGQPSKPGGGDRPISGTHSRQSSEKDMVLPWTPACDIYSVGMTLMSFALGSEGCYIVEPGTSKYEHHEQNRRTSLQEKLELAKNPLSPLLVKLICQCLDPVADKRPTALDILSISIKATRSQRALQSSLSFWRAMASQSSKGAQAVIGRTVNRFSTGYLYDVPAHFSSLEACILMGLISLYQANEPTSSTKNSQVRAKNTTTTALTTVATIDIGGWVSTSARLVQGLQDTEPGETILHAIAGIPRDEKVIRNLAWELTKWPMHPSLHAYALKQNHQNLRPAIVAALQGDEAVAKIFLQIEEKVREDQMGIRVARNIEVAVKTEREKHETEMGFIKQYILNENRSRPWKPRRMEFAAHLLLVAAGLGHVNAVRMLIEGLQSHGVGADVRVGEEKRTALHAAAAGGQVDVIRVLLASLAATDHPGSHDRPDGNHMTPLHMAAARGQDLGVAALLDGSGVDINRPGIRDKTALYLAAAYGHYETVVQLVKRGADRSVKGGTDGLTPAEVASKNGHAQIYQFLESKGGPTNPRPLRIVEPGASK